MKRLYSTLFLLVFLMSSLYSRHIIGGVITYECIGGGTYNFTMTMYRDCSDLNGANFDFFAPVAIYKGDSQIPLDTLFVTYDGVVDVPPMIDNDCLQIPEGVCVQRAVYEFSYTFTDWPSNDSYHITYQRCCRNNNITNIQFPGQVGATFTVELLPKSQELCNNSPTYNTPTGISLPPILICSAEPLSYDHTAYDAEGDQLIYEMCEPLIGGGLGGLGGGDPNACDGITPTPPCAPPYETVTYVNPPYNVLTPLGGDPAVTINPVTGLLSGVPTATGQFSVGVCVSEFRNGELLSVIRRDFQFNVEPCDPTVVAEIQATEQIDEDNYRITSCNEFEVDMMNISFEEEFIDNFRWEFDIEGRIDTFFVWSPTVIFPAHGVYTGRLMLNPGSDCGDTAFVEVHIFPEVIADFTFDYDTCVAGPVFFEDASYFVGGESTIIEWDWDYANGDIDSVASPVYIYQEPGDYLVSLHVLDENGCEDTYAELVTYKPVPALILVSPNDVLSCPPAEIFFNNLSSPINTEYQIDWDFGDGQTGTAISPTHIYQDSGVYTVNLSITSPEGCTTDTTYTDLIRIESPPVADFTFDPPQASNIEPAVNFFDASQNAAAWEWYINQAFASTETNPTFNFLDTGLHEILLVVTHEQFCQDSLTRFIDVEPLTFFHMPNAFTPNEDTINDGFKGNGLLLGVTDFNMSVWDRWGKLVFSTDDPKVAWNGQVQNNGRQATAGVYVYTVNFTGPRGKAFEYRGQATLIR